ncbi:UNVERIFIED_ORG: hypothetical protein GGD58_001526 [Rhizobium pisi]
MERRTVPATGSGGGGGAGSGGDACDISFDVDLSGVNIAVAQTVSVGEVLSVDLDNINGFDVVVCRKQANMQVVGSVAAIPQLGQLIGCLRSGRVYTATVAACNVSIVTVHVELV